MKIIVQTSWCHPEFGGTRIETLEFGIDEGGQAQEAYERMKKDDCHCQHTHIYISHSVFHVTDK
ncbi:unnamed protein product [marine sediment metagenome]|uniref:Uncharacterized protein n=1 Tax=marine sediment metagenome TaxID=412755 RepID=X0XQA2_9ZZZZ